MSTSASVPAPDTTPSAQRARMTSRTLIGALVIVSVLGSLLFWMESRKQTARDERKERARAHVILRPKDETQDWRLKEGARVDELHRTIEELQRQLKGLEEQRERDKKRGDPTAGAAKPGARLGALDTPPLPPLADILPPANDRVAGIGQPSVGRKARLGDREPSAAPNIASRGTLTPKLPGQTAAATAPSTPPTAPSAEPPEGTAFPGKPDRAPTFPSARPTPRASDPTSTGSADPSKLRVITPRLTPSSVATTTSQEKVGWLPSGSFIPARLISGVDAGTGTGTALPYPILMQLTDPAILPNYFRMDVEQCFAIGAAFGDLPSERVYIRTENLSCLRRSGGIITIDAEMKGHVIGEDGKVGLRGRVVTKEGAMIARSMLAGFLAGLGDAFKPRISYAPIQLGGTDVTNNQSFALPPMTDTLAAAGLSGMGKSMDLLAKYYMEQAQKLYPVIEVESGRTVDIMVLKGMAIKTRTQKASADTRDFETIE